MVVFLKVLWLGFTMAVATPAYPPVNVLEQQLHIYPGAQLPKDVAYNGQLFHPHYVKSVTKGNGEYIIVIQLNR